MVFTHLYRVCAQSSREEADYTCWDPLLGDTKKQLTLVNIFRLSLHIYPPGFICILVIFVLVCTGSITNKLIYGMRVHRNTWGRVSQAWKWVWKWNNDTSYFRLKQLIGMDAGRYADNRWQIICACAVVFPPKWWSRLLWHHQMTSQESLVCKREGSINRGAQLNLREFGCCCIVIWVFRHTL